MTQKIEILKAWYVS